MKKMLVRGLIALLVLVIVGLLVAFTNQDQDTSASAPATTVSNYSIDWHNAVEDLPIGVYNFCNEACGNRNFAEWIRLGNPPILRPSRPSTSLRLKPISELTKMATSLAP